MSKVMSTSIGTVSYVSIKFLKKAERKQKMVINIEQRTNQTYKHGDKCA